MNRRFSALAAPRLTVNPDHKPWTDEDDDRLAAMFRNNDTDAVMAEALGRTKKAIGLRRIWLGLNRRVQGTGKVMDPEQRAAAVVLASEVGASKAAEAVGVTDRTIVRWRNGHTQKVAPTDAPGRVVPNEWTKRDEDRLREMFAAKMSDEEIAAEMGRTPVAIGWRRVRLGLRYRRRRAEQPTRASRTVMPRQKRAASKPSNHRRHWTGREKRELWRLHEAGASNGDIAAALGRTKQSVNDMVHGLGKRRRKPRAVVVLPRRSRTPLLIAAALAACIATGSIWWVLQ